MMLYFSAFASMELIKHFTCYQKQMRWTNDKVNWVYLVDIMVPVRRSSYNGLNVIVRACLEIRTFDMYLPIYY